MTQLKVLIGDRQLTITDVRPETLTIGEREVRTGRLVITTSAGRRESLPLGVVPRAPCRFCLRMKPINEYCEATARCKLEHERAERVLESLHREHVKKQAGTRSVS